MSFLCAVNEAITGNYYSVFQGFWAEFPAMKPERRGCLKKIFKTFFEKPVLDITFGIGILCLVQMSTSIIPFAWQVVFLLTPQKTSDYTVATAQES